MGLFVCFLKVGESGVGVDFRRGHTFVSQKFSNRFKVGTVVKHHGGERVSQDVRATLLLRSDKRKVLLHHPLHLPREMRCPLSERKSALFSPPVLRKSGMYSRNA